MTPDKYYLYSEIAEKILSAINQDKSSVEISVDLNKSTKKFLIKSGEIIFDNNALNKDALLDVAKKKNRIFVLENNKLQCLEIRQDGYYKLVPTDTAPTVEISGVKMHRSKGIDPFTDAKQKATEVVKQGSRVLDTCGGLGYTAIWALKLGAREIISVEVNESIQKLRESNPWSQELYDNKIKLMSADISSYIKTLNAEYFDVVIHDPPRFSLAGELYGKEFYIQLYRVLVKGGVLFHYTGNPYLVHKGELFMNNVVKRLKLSGFRKVLKKPHLLGVKALK